MTRKHFIATAAGAVATLATLGMSQAASAQPSPVRGEIGSARNIQHVRAALEQLIDQLQHDQRDFGGFRVRAIADMQRARYNLLQALQWDATHPR